VGRRAAGRPRGQGTDAVPRQQWSGHNDPSERAKRSPGAQVGAGVADLSAGRRLCLLVVAALAIVGLVRYLPAHKNTASAVATTNASASATTTGSAKASASASQPNPTQSATSAAPSTGASAGASDGSSPGTGSSPIPTTSAVAATGGGAGAPIADLSALNPVTTSEVSTPATGPQQIGATTYEDSVRFTCYSSSGSVIYDVAGYKYLTTLIGIPSNASNGAGNAMTITFYKDGSATQLSSPVTVTLDHPQSIHLNLQGSSQLEIACSAINTSNQQTAYMDVALGNATIGPN
jgi:hypothetical protein